MKQLLAFALLLFCTTNILAQNKPYTDYRPKYRKWLDSYIIDKITYTKENTIIYFRFVCENKNSGGATFYPPGGQHPWYLKGRTVRKDYDLVAVKNIRRNGILVKDNVVGTPFHSNPVGRTGYTIFSCEVHFDRLPKEMKEADLIEGRGQEYNRRHFNCFNVKLKTWDDKDLGKPEDSEEKVSNFEKKYKAYEKKKEEEKKELEAHKAEEYKKGSTALTKADDLACGKLLLLDKVHFHDNSTKFKGMVEVNRTLSMLFNFLKDNPQTKVTLHGHTDVFGDKEKNKQLSKDRAVKVQRWLTMYGIHPKRIAYEGHGSDHPLVKEGDASNRRVEAKITCD